MCAMTSAQRVFTTLSHQEPDRVPLALNLVLRGARELGLSIRDYFSDPANVVEAQLRLQQRFRSDVLFGFFHAALEYEAWGGEVVFTEDGPPNSGAPVLGSHQPLSSLRLPELAASKGLLKVLQAIEAMKARVGDEVPILGVAVSPYSLPVLQLGFDRYIELLLGDRAEFWTLMEQNRTSRSARAGPTPSWPLAPAPSCTSTPWPRPPSSPAPSTRTPASRWPSGLSRASRGPRSRCWLQAAASVCWMTSPPPGPWVWA